MARKPRIEYAGAVYHVMARGDRREAIFLDDRDRRLFLETLGEACERTGWRVRAYVLMPNHYHWLLHTPEPNLVAGMKWFQGTYTLRFHARHQRCGHLFQGRYKAIPVDGRNGYQATVINYIHLNPARAGLVEVERESLDHYAWSSYPAILCPAQRPEWLDAESSLRILDLADTPHGRGRHYQYMQRRLLEIAMSDAPWDVDERWAEIRSGWCYGPESFKAEMQERLDKVVGYQGNRQSYSGDEVRQHDKREAEQLLADGLATLQLSPQDLSNMRKSAPEKQALAWLVRTRTCVSNAWISDQLHMGRATNLARHVRAVEQPEGVRMKLREQLEKMMRI